MQICLSPKAAYITMFIQQYSKVHNGSRPDTIWGRNPIFLFFIMIRSSKCPYENKSHFGIIISIDLPGTIFVDKNRSENITSWWKETTQG